jgi:fucose permease
MGGLRLFFDLARASQTPYSEPQFPDGNIPMKAPTDVPAPGLSRGRATWYAYLALGYQTLMATSQGNILPFLKSDLGLTYGEASLHPSAVAVGMLIVGSAGGVIIHRLGRAATMAYGVLVTALGAMLLCLATAAWQSVAACLVLGIASSFMPAMTSAILYDLHGRRRDIAYAEANAICYAFAITSPLVIAVTAALGWDWRLAVFVSVAIGVAVVLVFKDTPLPEAKRSETASRTPLPPAYWAYFTMLGLSVALEFAALLWAPSYFEQVVGLSKPAAAAAAGAFFAAMLIGRTAGVRLFKTYSTRSLFFVAMVTIAVGFLIYWLGVSAPAVTIIGLFLLGLGIANLFPIVLGFAMNTAGGATERASARAVIAPGVAILVSPPLLGMFADHAGLHTAQLMLPAYGVLAVVAYFVARGLERRA